MTSKSSSNTSAATTNLNEDNRISSDGGSIALGKNAALQINNELPDNVVDVFKGLIEFAAGAGDAVLKSSAQAISANENALSKVATIADKQTQGESRIYTDLFPLVALGLLGLVAVTLLKKGK